MIHNFMNLVFDIFIHNKINSGMEKDGLRMAEWKFQGSLSRMNIIKSEGTYTITNSGRVTGSQSAKSETDLIGC